MEWPKLKNIVLLILVITNLCLLAFVARWEIQDTRLQRQARAEAIQFLSGKGVSVDESQVPHNMTLMPQTVERDLSQEGALAARLLGDGVQAQDRGAGVYRYFNDRGSIQFHSDGAFQAELSPGAFPLGEDRATACLALLGQLDYEGELLDQQGNSLIFRQVWNGVPLFTQQVTLELSNGCLVSITSGRRLVGQPVADPSRKPITVATALIQLFNGINALGDVCSRIDTISQGYVTATSLSDPILLTPVWRVSTDTGSYQLDTVTGALIRVS